jgi:hypothetical protein
MKATIKLEVKDRKQARAIRLALQDPEVLAYVTVLGILIPLPSDRARKRVLDFVWDSMEEAKQQQAST